MKRSIIDILDLSTQELEELIATAEDIIANPDKYAHACIDTLEIDDEQLESLVTPRTRSVLLVHLYGRCAYTEKIGALPFADGRLLLCHNVAKIAFLSDTAKKRAKKMGLR